VLFHNSNKFSDQIKFLIFISILFWQKKNFIFMFFFFNFYWFKSNLSSFNKVIKYFVALLISKVLQFKLLKLWYVFNFELCAMFNPRTIYVMEFLQVSACHSKLLLSFPDFIHFSLLSLKTWFRCFFHHFRKLCSKFDLQRALFFTLDWNIEPLTLF